MRYTISINQKQAIELGLQSVTQAIILDLINGSPTWADAEIVDGKVYYWVSRTKIAKELPLLDLKPDSVYKHLKALLKLGLIHYLKVGKNDCVRLTQLGKSYYVIKKSDLDEKTEKNPTKNGKKSEKNAEKNPTYNNTNLISVTNDQKEKEKEKDVSFSLSSSQISKYLLEKIKTINPSFKQPNLKIWVKDIDLAIRVDGRTAGELEQCIEWIYSPAGAFWQQIVLSGAKLRKNFDTMFIQAKSSGAQKAKGVNAVNNLYCSGYTATQVLTAMGASNV